MQPSQNFYGTMVEVEGEVMFAFGSSVPSDAAAGYGKGCLFVNTGASDQSTLLYANIGTASSANFNLVTIASD